jgi:hypothetical protein
MSVFITIRIGAAICPRARPSQPDMDTLHRPPVSGASSGSLLASKPGSYVEHRIMLSSGKQPIPSGVLPADRST